MSLSVQTLKIILVVLSVLACVVITFFAPIVQDPSYHIFADQRSWGFVPSFWNVISNFGFFVVGLLGLYQLHMTQKLNIIPVLKLSYSFFFAAVILVALGSGYYHWQPNNHTLVWDRLPMTLAFMSLMSFALGEFLSLVWARRSLWPLLLLGLISVLYWALGEAYGEGDLSLYVLVQFLPIILLLILFVFGRPVFSDNSGYWWLFVMYIAAKIFEHFDSEIYIWSHHLMAGHAIKHMISALGLYVLLRTFRRRTQRGI